MAREITIAYAELKKREGYLKEYIKGLEEMMFITSHKVRQPIAHIIGISSLLDDLTNYSADEMKRVVVYIKQSALALHAFTNELTAFMADLDKKGRPA